FARCRPIASERGNCRFAPRFSADAQDEPDFRGAARGNSGVPGEWHAGAGADQPARIFVVRAVPELRSFGTVRELQHLDDASQAAQPAGMSLLRIDSSNSKGLSEVPIEVRLFFWRRLGALGRTAAQGIPRRAHRPAG